MQGQEDPRKPGESPLGPRGQTGRKAVQKSSGFSIRAPLRVPVRFRLRSHYRGGSFKGAYKGSYELLEGLLQWPGVSTLVFRMYVITCQEGSIHTTLLDFGPPKP